MEDPNPKKNQDAARLAVNGPRAYVDWKGAFTGLCKVKVFVSR